MDKDQTTTSKGAVNAKAGIFKGVSEEKLLGILLLGLGALLVVVLLVWRSLDQQGAQQLEPPSEAKRSVWFDKGGPMTTAGTESPDKTQAAAPSQTKNQSPAQKPAIENAPAAEILKVETLNVDRAAQSELPRFWVQLGTFSQVENADALAQRTAEVAPQVEVLPLKRGDKTLYSVRVPSFSEKAEAEALSSRLASALKVTPLLVQAGE